MAPRVARSNSSPARSSFDAESPSTVRSRKLLFSPVVTGVNDSKAWSNAAIVSLRASILVFARVTVAVAASIWPWWIA